ncbi:MAG: alpha/beta fold hydrolase [Pseudonocardia sp.]
MLTTTERDLLLAGAPVGERRLALAGMSTAVLECGSGPPLVLLHGPGVHAAAWLPVMPALAETHRVVALDLPGQGASPADPPLDADRMLDWLDALVEATCPQPPVLVGQLTGGAIAARYAARPGARLRALVLVVPLGLEPFAPSAAFGAALTTHLHAPDLQTHDELWRQCVHDLGSVQENLGDRWTALRAYNLALAADPVIGAGLQRLLADFGLPAIPPATLERIAVPTRLVWGAKDAIVPLAVARRATDRYGWPLHVIAGVGNEPALEAPSAFVEAVLR